MARLYNCNLKLMSFEYKKKELALKTTKQLGLV